MKNNRSWKSTPAQKIVDLLQEELAYGQLMLNQRVSAGNGSANGIEARVDKVLTGEIRVDNPYSTRFSGEIKVEESVGFSFRLDNLAAGYAQKVDALQEKVTQRQLELVRTANSITSLYDGMSEAISTGDADAYQNSRQELENMIASNQELAPFFWNMTVTLAEQLRSMEKALGSWNPLSSQANRMYAEAVGLRLLSRLPSRGQIQLGDGAIPTEYDSQAGNLRAESPYR